MFRLRQEMFTESFQIDFPLVVVIILSLFKTKLWRRSRKKSFQCTNRLPSLVSMQFHFVAIPRVYFLIDTDCRFVSLDATEASESHTRS